MRARKGLLLIGLAAALTIPADLPVTARENAPSLAVSSGGFCPRSIRWQDAENHVGEQRRVRGPVISTKYARGSTGRPTFLNVGRAFPNPNRFTVVIWGRNRDRFPAPPENLYRGEYICVRGRIRLFEGVPETFLSSPGNIEVRGEP